MRKRRRKRDCKVQSSGKSSVLANSRLGVILIGLAKQKQHIPLCFCKENKEQIPDFCCISQTKQVNHKSEIVTAGQVQLHKSYTQFPPSQGESWRVTQFTNSSLFEPISHPRHPSFPKFFRTSNGEMSISPVP